MPEAREEGEGEGEERVGAVGVRKLPPSRRTER